MTQTPNSTSNFDDGYYDRVATLLSRMEPGQSITITKIVMPENREKFIECFRRFAGLALNGPYWFDWDDEKMIITKHKRFW